MKCKEILVENRRFEPTPPLLGAQAGAIWLEFCPDFWHQKTRVPGLSYGIVSVILGLPIFVELRLVTDRRETDGHAMTAYTALALHCTVKISGCPKDSQLREKI